MSGVKVSYRVTWVDHAERVSTIVLKSDSFDAVEGLAADMIRGMYYGSFTIMRIEEASRSGWRDVTECTSFYSG